MEGINSVAAFKSQWLCWKSLGIVPVEGKFKWLYLLYAVLVNGLITICFPVHLTLALLSNTTLKEYIQTCAVCVICVSTSIKFFLFAGKLQQVRHMEAILRRLDARVSTAAERAHCRQIKKDLGRIVRLFQCLFMPVGIMLALNTAVSQERKLQYPGWFPWDWNSSTAVFYLSNAYQISGTSLQIWMNYANDGFTAKSLCLLSGHVKLLGLRVSQIGYNNEGESECEQALLQCIHDQKRLYRLYHTIHGIVSLPLFIQFCVTAFNLCMVIAALAFHSDTLFDKLYFMSCVVSIPQQVFPSCYYGSDFQDMFSELPHAIFCSNWIFQSRRYKKNMIIFIERARNQTRPMAAGILPIGLETFFGICKGTYSLFALVLNTEN